MAIFPSTVIVSSNPDIKPILTELQTGQPDLLVIDSDYSIAQVRNISNFLSRKPYSHQNKLVVIYQADQLGTESQNALLKTLEEPGPNNYIVLTTDKPTALLPTIISRCSIVKTISPTIVSSIPLLKISPDLKTNLLQSEKITADKESVLPFLRHQLTAYHQTLPQNPQNAKIIKKIIKAIDMIESNVDPKSAIDYLLIS